MKNDERHCPICGLPFMAWKPAGMLPGILKDPPGTTRQTCGSPECHRAEERRFYRPILQAAWGAYETGKKQETLIIEAADAKRKRMAAAAIWRH